MVPKKVIDYLKKNKKPFELLTHKTVFTAFDAAQTLKVKLNAIVKSLMVKADKDYYLVSLPADKNIDFGALKKALHKAGAKVKNISIIKENVLTKVFRIKPGTLTGFSKLHKVRAIVDRDIKKLKDVVISGGSVTQSIRMKLKDYLAGEEPLVAAIGKKRKIPPAPRAAAKRKK